jgi:hypothetical protein
MLSGSPLLVKSGLGGSAVSRWRPPGCPMGVSGKVLATVGVQDLTTTGDLSHLKSAENERQKKPTSLAGFWLDSSTARFPGIKASVAPH